MQDQQAEGELSDASAEAKFKEIFIAFYKPLQYYAYTIMKDETVAEEIVQEIFCRLWERNGRIQLQKATQAYLYKAVYNESMNVLKKMKVQARHNAQLKPPVTESITDLKSLQEKTVKALNELPCQCRTIFQMSRFEEMKYREIAEKLGISVKTVEAQMSKALRHLRIKLKDFLPVLWLFIVSIKK